MNNFYVYAHYTLDTDELFYIGKGKNNRCFDSWGRNRYWKRIVKKHDYRVEILIKNLEEPDAFIQEILAIKELNPKANISKGGTGGFIAINDGNYQKGHKPWNTGKKCPIIGQRQMGKSNHMYGKPSIRRKKVKCENDGKVFDCISDAANFYTINRPAINGVLSGKTDTVKGLIFTYLNYPELNKKALKIKLLRKKNDKREKKKIICIESGVEYRSITDCARILNLQTSNIIKVLGGHRKTTGGLRFQYV